MLFPETSVTNGVDGGDTTDYFIEGEFEEDSIGMVVGRDSWTAGVEEDVVDGVLSFDELDKRECSIGLGKAGVSLWNVHVVFSIGYEFGDHILRDFGFIHHELTLYCFGESLKVTSCNIIITIFQVITSITLNGTEEETEGIWLSFMDHGSYENNRSFQIYFTRVRLGFPPKDFYVVIDTGSDVLWVSCIPCNGCPTYSLVQNRLEFFDPSSSSTARPVLCSDKICAIGGKSCAAQNHCGYAIHYGDGSGTSGYYIADFMHFDTIPLTNSSARIVFGCSTYRTGELLTKPDRAIDGVFGLGQLGFLVIAQLATQGVTPNVFSHCLKGSNGRGGVLVLGQAVEPNLVYTPLVPSQPHYSVILEGIALNGQTLSINPELFKTRSNRVPWLIQELLWHIFQKKLMTFFLMLVSDIFPMVSLNFAGGATMVLRGEDYLIHRYSTRFSRELLSTFTCSTDAWENFMKAWFISSLIGGSEVWCMSFQKSLTQGWTILGGSQPINVSTTRSQPKTKSGQSSVHSDPSILFCIGVWHFLLVLVIN
ncbi:putative aspartic proteinase-like protein 2-like isoform X2 [Capsicum annuum]|nr:putative aspartic proteinase-like protein 2-like isoform X2 [Capsicum annuum]